MKNLKLFGIFLSLSLICTGSFAITGLSKGFDRSLTKTPFREIKKTFGYRPAYLVRQGNGEIYYGLSRDGQGLAYYDLVTKPEPIGWPLTPWPNNIRMKGEGTNWKARPIIAGALGGDTSEIPDPKIMVLNTQEYALPAFKEFIGCLASTPLRYGDIDNNNTDELVLILDDQIAVFSPNLQKTIFSTQFSINDELKPEEVDAWFDAKENAVQTQYVAKSGVGNRLSAAFPATRSFAKLFIDDFDGNGKPDIIVWRKLYESRLKTDPVLGFKLEGELLVHYQLENGEYQLQTNAPGVDGEFEWDDAQQAQIQNWLVAKNQTWQSGFPSKSECAGQEGQLIPEMHDPLLNDPLIVL